MQTLALLLTLFSLLAQPLLLLLRDAQGQPVADVALSLYEAGPPETLRARCVTDVAGTCRMQIAPGAYLLRFDEVPAGDDFAFYLAPAEEEQVLSFVLEEGLPLWDLSRDPAAAPQPFRPESGPQDGIDPLTFGQQFESQLAPGLAPTLPVESTPLLEAAASASPEASGGWLLALVPLLAVILLVLALYALRRKEGR